MNNWTIRLIPFLILGTSLQFSCNRQNESEFANLQEVESDSIIICDTFFALAVELVKLDSFLIYDGKHYMRRLFSTYDMETFEESRIPFLNVYHDSISKKGLVEEKKIDTIFTAEELSMNSYQNSEIVTKCFPQYSFISKDSVKSWHKEYETNHNKESLRYYSFSRPIISASGNYFIIEMDEHCYGLCGSGMTFLYQLENNQWTQVWAYCRWVS